MIKEYFVVAYRSLFTHKIRSLLTMLGVIIGVSSVIMLISLGNSAKNEAANQIRKMGSNLVLISVYDQAGYLPKVWLEELKEKAKIKEYSPYLEGVSNYNIEGKNFSSQVIGVNEKYARIASLEFAKGRFFKKIDVDNNQTVAVIGKTVANKLFPNKDPINKTISIKGIQFKIVGITKEKGTNFGGDMDKVIYIPYSFAASLFSSVQKTYYASSISEKTTDYSKSKIESYLSHKLPSKEMFIVFNQSQIISMLDEIMGLLTTLLAGIASISLVVGGIGIMNIMLVTVRERTKEIGIRKALGARKNYILLQFLIEAIIITIFGGLFGLLLSFIGSLIITSLAGFTVTLGLNSVLLALLFSCIIGIIFGLYPANKASNLEPVDALRFE